ncbi:MAG: mechanosensitive ion channel [Flavobacteriales bacterium]|nr:mechanosensitive ion channel [Flavobacteriales bacterium]
MIDEMNKAEAYTTRLLDMAIAYAPKVVAAILVYWIGSVVIKLVAKMLGKVLDARGVELTLRRFLNSLVTIGLRVVLIITVVGMLGVQTTSFIAILGAAGLAIGLALQGTLANFAGGTLILFFKPYKVGDLIEAQGITGVVKEIQIFTTVLLTPENKTAIIPNGPMANGNIINHTREGSVRVDLTFGLDGTAPIGAAREVLMGVMRQHPNVLKEPAPSVNIAKLTLDGVELAVRPYCAPGDY